MRGSGFRSPTEHEKTSASNSPWNGVSGHSAGTSSLQIVIRPIRKPRARRSEIVSSAPATGTSPCRVTPRRIETISSADSGDAPNACSASASGPSSRVCASSPYQRSSNSSGVRPSRSATPGRTSAHTSTGQPQDEPSVQARAREEDLAARVHPLEQRLVLPVRAVAAEADNRERPRRGQLPARLVPNPALEELRQPDPPPDHLLQALTAGAAQHGPELQRAEASTELDAVLTETDDLVRRAQVLGHHAERSAQRIWSSCPEGGASLRRQEPLVRVDAERVGSLDPLERPAQLGTDHRAARVSRIDVQPDPCLRARLGNRRDRIDRRRGSCAHRRDHRANAVELERLRPQPELRVDRNLAQLEPDQLARAVDRRVRLLRAEHEAGLDLPSRRQRAQRRLRRTLLQVSVPAGRQPEKLRQPAERHLLQLLQRRRSAPEDADLVQP